MAKFHFFRESKKYMEGESRWYFWTRLPIAYIKFQLLRWKYRNILR